jgi:hypothetical protein
MPAGYCALLGLLNRDATSVCENTPLEPANGVMVRILLKKSPDIRFLK